LHWITNDIFHGLFYVQWFEVRDDVHFVDVLTITDLAFIFLIKESLKIPKG